MLLPYGMDWKPEDAATASQATERTLKNYLGETKVDDIQFAARMKMNISGKRLAVMSKIPRGGSLQYATAVLILSLVPQ
jgi:hypothetical protein